MNLPLPPPDLPPIQLPADPHAAFIAGVCVGIILTLAAVLYVMGLFPKLNRM